MKVGPSGKIAITFRQDAQIWIYDATGKRLAKFGRKGQGPGEFAQMQVQGWRGDTVWVFDYVLNRNTFLTSTGRLVRVVPLAEGLTARGNNANAMLASAFAPHAMLTDGATLGFACLRTPVQGSRRAIVRATPSGEPSVVMPLPADETCQATFGGVNPLIFRPQTVFRPDGSAFAQIRVDSLVKSSGTFSIEVFDGSGRRVLTKRIPYAGEPIPSRVADSIIATMMPTPKNDPEGLLRESAKEAITKARSNVPPVYAPIIGMTFGQDGTMWIGLRPTSGHASALVMDAAGNQLALVPLPPRSDLVAGSATELWVRQHDDDGLTSIVRYRIEGITCARAGCR